MLIRTHPASITHGGTTYSVRICGKERVDGTWEGWLEFRPTGSSQPILVTEWETSQPNRTALEYWADGLEPIYLEGALARAQGRCYELTRSGKLVMGLCSHRRYGLAASGRNDLLHAYCASSCRATQRRDGCTALIPITRHCDLAMHAQPNRR